MKIKTNLHFHTAEDIHDPGISYTAEEGIREAARLGFGALALTLHERVGWTPSLADYARKHGLLLIPGIEKNIGITRNGKRHTLILNADHDAERVETYSDLARYRRARPDIFVIAAHPYFPGPTCHRHNTERFIHLFDGIEHSWFYARSWNKNIPAEHTANMHNKPFIATSDTHFYTFLDTDYAVIEAREHSIPALFEALRNGAFKNYTRPKNLLSEMAYPLARFELRRRLYAMRQ